MSGTASNNISSKNLILAALGTAFIAPLQYELGASTVPSLVLEYHQLTNNSWETPLPLLENNDQFGFGECIKSFSDNLLSNTEDIDLEILRVVNKNFWDLI